MATPDSAFPTQTHHPLLRVPAAALLLLSAVWSVLSFIHGFGFIEDDAYIHLEFARSVANGHGFAFNGHVVYGDTAPLWVLLLVLVHGFVAHWELAAKVLGAAGLLLAATGAYACAKKLTGDARFAAWMVLVLVLNPYVVYWSFSGMETVAAAGLALWLATLVADRQFAWRQFYLAALMAGLAPLLRPEMVFLTGIVALVLAFRWWNIATSIGKKVPALIAGAALVTGPSLAWAWYAVRTFGRVVPNTNAAKRAGPDDSVVRRLVQVYSFGYPVLALGATALLVAAAFYIVRHRTDGREGVLRSVPLPAWVFVAWTAVTTVFYLENHTYVQTRYILPSASGLVLCGLAMVLLRRPRALWPFLAFATAVPMVCSVAYAWPNVHNKVIGDRALARMCAWVTQNLPANAPIALYPIGEVAFLSEQPVVDTGGITRPGAIPFLNSPLQMERWLRSEGATYALAGTSPEPGAVLVYSIAKPVTGWPLNPRTYFEQDERYNLWKLPVQPQGANRF